MLMEPFKGSSSTGTYGKLPPEFDRADAVLKALFKAKNEDNLTVLTQLKGFENSGDIIAKFNQALYDLSLVTDKLDDATIKAKMEPLLEAIKVGMNPTST